VVIRLKGNRSQVLERIAAACRAAGRDPSEVRLVAITKSVPAELAAELVALGHADLGENRADALAAKHAALAARALAPRWHFVGHLQRNKARRVLELADEIHSVDSPALWETLARLGRELGRAPGIYLQVKLADEPTKSGLAPAELPALVERARGGPLPLLGLMTLAPLLDDEREARRAARDVFARAAELAAALPAGAFAHGRPLLSMGMSQDFEQAIACGAHVVRIGSALFEGCLAASGGGER
jgi:pyridoxal phosphate enzyme (YggS family)